MTVCVRRRVCLCSVCVHMFVCVEVGRGEGGGSERGGDKGIVCLIFVRTPDR